MKKTPDSFILLVFAVLLSLAIPSTIKAQKALNVEPAKNEIQSVKPNLVPEFSSQAEKDAWIRNQQAMKKSEYNRAQNITAPMPDFTNEAEKDEWMKLNPPKTVVTRSEFESLPPRKQASMKADSNYIILD
jgi:hypothetical protein